jgi:3-hydroxyisobutyrate dehydrogenase
MNKPQIAFLGLGIMGSGMARRLLANGYSVMVYNRSVEKSKALAADGAKVAKSPRDAAAGAGAIISMVADDNASRALWFGESGALVGAARGTICIECSTVSVDWVCELAAAVEAKQCEFLDAPVTGSKSHAAAGELNFLVGGGANTLDRVRPLFAAMAKTVSQVGPIGSGALLKLINNFVCGVQVAAFAQALAMIERSGLDRSKALEVLTNGAPGSPIVKLVASRMTAPDYTPNFLMRLMAKDLNYACKEAGKLSIELTTALAAHAEFQKAIVAGYGDKDTAAVVEPLRQR